MHKEILTENQLKLLSLLKDFSNDYILVGGTAIALYLGHRYSIDFDLFTSKVIKRKSIKNYLIKNGHSLNQLIKEEADQIHFMVNDVKIAFFQYPFSINETVDFESIIKIPTLINLAAMKAFALGGRGKWKDYVDIYFLLKDHFSLDDIIKRAEGLFGNVFNDKLFREQLTYFEDINYDEEVIYLNTPIDNDVIKKFLIDAATEKF